ncbi:MAG TPA: sensor histidine kinase [Bryobacteraceae bacterium]
MNFWASFLWPRSISWVRAVLAAAALGLGYLYIPDATVLIRAVMVLFLAYSIVLAIRGKGLAGLLGLLTLFGDTVYFLVLASYSTEHLLWLASIFYLYLMMEALASYTPVQLGVVAGSCAVFCSLLPSGAVKLLEPTVVVAGALAFAFGTTSQRQTAKIDALNDKVKEAQKAAEKAREEERQRIASDFHDGPLQSFISLQMRLEILRKLLDRDAHAGMEDLRQLQALAQSQIRDLRAFLHSMRPVDVDGANLVATARRTAESFQKESGIPVTFLGANTAVGLPQEMSSEVLQMLREALHNVQKHSAATRVAVALEKTDRGLEISVDDNGHGFNFAGTYTLEELELLRLGPASLKRRARSLNADLILESRPGRGAGIRFRIPLQ